MLDLKRQPTHPGVILREEFVEPLGLTQTDLAKKLKTTFRTVNEILNEKRKLHAKFLQFKFHDIGRSVLESAIGRGDRRLCDVIEAAWQAGARFDLWDECFDPAIWRGAFEKFGFDLESLAQRQFAPDEILPWEHLGGPDEKYLLGHLDKAMEEAKNVSGIS